MTSRTHHEIRPTLVLSGAAGRIGEYLRHVDGGLPAHPWRLHLVNVAPPDDVTADERITQADSSVEESLDALADARTGADAVVHLAGIPSEDAWTRICRTNIDGSYQVLEAARLAGVPRDDAEQFGGDVEEYDGPEDVLGHGMVTAQPES